MEKVYPDAELPIRDTDVPVTLAACERISFLARLQPPSRKLLPMLRGAMRLRCFEEHEPICIQGEEDCTAFYILTLEDLHALQQYHNQRLPSLLVELEQARRELAELEEALRQRNDAAQDENADSQTARTNSPLVKLKEEVKGAQAALVVLEQELEMRPAQAIAMSRFSDAASQPGTGRREAAEVTILPALAPVQAKRRNWFRRRRHKSAPEDDLPTYLAFEGPAGITAKTRSAVLFEGDLFGEMACLQRTPRTATVTAVRRIYALEFLSNVLTQIAKDPVYLSEQRRIYIERVLDLQLRDLSIFRFLTDAEYGEIFPAIRPHVELVEFSGGQVICDEHDRSDCIYLIRNGFVQVRQRVSSLLKVGDILDRPSLFKRLCEQREPAEHVWKHLPEQVRKTLECARLPEDLDDNAWEEIIDGLNAVIKDNRFAKLPGMDVLGEHPGVKQRMKQVPPLQPRIDWDKADVEETIFTASVRQSRKSALEPNALWPDLDSRRRNRLLLEEIFTRCLLPLHLPYSQEVLNYLSGGDFFGEMGVWRQHRRAATCVAYGQPDTVKEPRRVVELVRIPSEAFRELMMRFPVVRHNVERVIRTRKQEAAEQLSNPSFHEHIRSGRAVELGLVQGRQLMLIDLNRCTRCDECVRACADSHPDGRSRLFLTGPRFQDYLVPITCRACRDPVCMIDCPTRAIQRGEHGQMVIKHSCVACYACARNCPYDAIKMHSLSEDEAAADAKVVPPVYRIRPQIAVVCDLCSNLPDRQPRCVYACPHDAAQRRDGFADWPGDGEKLKLFPANASPQSASIP